MFFTASICKRVGPACRHRLSWTSYQRVQFPSPECQQVDTHASGRHSYFMVLRTVLFADPGKGSRGTAAAAAGRRRRGSRGEAVTDFPAASGQQSSAADDLQGQPAQVRAGMQTAAARQLRDAAAEQQYQATMGGQALLMRAGGCICVRLVHDPIITEQHGQPALLSTEADSLCVLALA